MKALKLQNNATQLFSHSVPLMCRLVAKLVTPELAPQREKAACGRLGQGQGRQHEDEDGKSTSTFTSTTRSTENSSY